MKTVTYDFETYWDTGFSLSKISFMQYIKSPLFEAISCSIKEGNGPTEVVFGEDAIRARLKKIDWANTAAIAHNGNEFDHPILVWVFDCHPKMFIDTLALARPQQQSSVGGSLAALSKLHNLPEKNATILHNTKGKRLADFSAAELADMAVYNKGDTENCHALWKIYGPSTPRTELLLSDMTARMICYPQFRCNVPLLDATLSEVQELKKRQLDELAQEMGCVDAEDVRKELASGPKFASLLESWGVDPPMKISKTTGQPAYAFAKTDEDFTDLLEHDDLRVQMAVAARLGVKSTLLETRLEKMAACADLMDGWMPVPLGYHSATTGRWGGRVWNPQNLPRIPRDKAGNVIYKPTNALRMSLRAPAGHKVVVSDLSGIELRVNHYLWMVASTAKLYAGDPEADLYKEFAAALFGKPVEQITKDERQLAKVAQLGLGFGAGAATFKRVAKAMGGIVLDDDEALRVTNAWRMKYQDIVNGWKSCQRAVAALFQGAYYEVDPRGLVKVENGKLVLPSGRKLYYPGMAQGVDSKGKTQYTYGAGKNHSKIYSGLLDENIVQAIARDVIAEQALTIWAKTGRIPALTVHDELVYIVPTAEACAHLNTINGIMRTPPAWLPGIVLWSEGDIADTYGDAK